MTHVAPTSMRMLAAALLGLLAVGCNPSLSVERRRSKAIDFVALGERLFRDNDLEQAEDKFWKAISWSPTPAAYAGLAACQLANGNFDDAASCYRKALELSPNNKHFRDMFEYASARAKEMESKAPKQRSPSE